MRVYFWCPIFGFNPAFVYFCRHYFNVYFAFPNFLFSFYFPIFLFRFALPHASLPSQTNLNHITDNPTNAPRPRPIRTPKLPPPRINQRFHKPRHGTIRPLLFQSQRHLPTISKHKWTTNPPPAHPNPNNPRPPRIHLFRHQLHHRAARRVGKNRGTRRGGCEPTS